MGGPGSNDKKVTYGDMRMDFVLYKSMDAYQVIDKSTMQTLESFLLSHTE